LQAHDVGSIPILPFTAAANSLNAAKVALCRFDRHMPEKKLNLLQFVSGGAT
jgi:hypothetical protein